MRGMTRESNVVLTVPPWLPDEVNSAPPARIADPWAFYWYLALLPDSYRYIKLRGYVAVDGLKRERDRTILPGYPRGKGGGDGGKGAKGAKGKGPGYGDGGKDAKGAKGKGLGKGDVGKADGGKGKGGKGGGKGDGKRAPTFGGWS